MRYFVVFLLSLTVIGCQPGQQSSQEANSVELVVWECFKYEEHEVFLELIAKFMAEYQQKTGQKVVIRAERVTFDDFETYLKLAALGGKAPDIACFDALKVLTFAYHKVLIPLDTLGNFEKSIPEEYRTLHMYTSEARIAAKRKQYMAGAFNTNVVNIKGETHLYGLPQQTTCLALFWNRRMFRQKARELEQKGLDPKSPPETWDELIEYAKVLTIKDKEQYGFAMQNKLWYTLPFFGCYQVSYIDTSSGRKRCSLGDPLSCAALQLKVDLAQKHRVEAGAWKPGAINTESGFREQKYAMILMGPWNIQKFRQEGLDFGISLIPKISQAEAERVGLLPKNSTTEQYNENITSATNVGGTNICVLRTCRYPEIAYDFINFISSTEAQLIWSRRLSQIPVDIEAAQQLRQHEDVDQDLKVFMKQAEYGTTPPMLPRYGYIENDIVNPAMELALKQQKSVKEALDDAARKVNEQILNLLEE